MPARARLAISLLLLLAGAAGTAAWAEDSGWPREFDSRSGAITVYQPQPEDLNGDLLAGRAAFSLQKPGAQSPVFGVLWFRERIEIDRDSSTVRTRAFDVTWVRLPGSSEADESQVEKLVESEAASWDLSGSLEELRAGLAAAEKERASVAGLDNDPPRILFVYERAILLSYDGTPLLEPIEGSALQRVANTPYAVIFDPALRRYYLAGPGLWYAARDPLGPWSPAERLPAEVRDLVPPDTSSADQIEGEPPRIVTATVPTELVSIDGQPRYAPLGDGQLLYVTNTESDVLREVSTQQLYVLLAGRWYSARGPNGPWTFVRPDQLPASFARIPPDSPKGNLLASVPGTEEADDAVADAEIPQTTAIRRSDVDFAVTYDGPPQFEDIPGSGLRYAVNTDAEVILADGRYYACDQGVWYVADDPDGPWSVSETRPLGVDDIPPSCPVYDVRYVYVYDVTPDVVYAGYLPGYIGCHPYDGVVVYGTGYRYRPWRGRHHYYPRPCTWGFHARYNPWLTRWSFGTRFTAGFLRTGTRWRLAAGPGRGHDPPRWFGPGGYRRPLLTRELQLVRERTPRRALPLLERTPANLYHRSVNLGRLDRAANRLPVQPVVRPAGPGSRANDVYAGRDGKVYRRDPRGNWSVNQGRGWTPARMPSISPGPTREAPRVPGGGGPTARPAWPPRAAPSPAPVAPATPQPGAPGVPRRSAPQPMPVAPARPPTGILRRPAPPALSPAPGNLERAFHAREHAREVEAPRPARPAPQVKERERGKPRQR